MKKTADKSVIVTLLLMSATVAATSIYTVWNLREQRKITKRMDRNRAFLTESETLRLKYSSDTGDEGKAYADELIALMNKYGL